MAKKSEKTEQNGEKPKYVGRGGWRGGGRPKGSLSKKTKTLMMLRERIAEKSDDLLNAELLEALGTNIILKLDPATKKYERVTDPDEVIAVVNAYKGGSEEELEDFYVITTQSGNYKSRQYLFDRAFGRPPQSVEITEDPQLAQLKQMITARAHEKGSTYEKELKLYLEKYAVTVAPTIKEKLASELVN